MTALSRVTLASAGLSRENRFETASALQGRPAENDGFDRLRTICDCDVMQTTP